MKKNDQTVISNFLIALLREKDYINYLERNEKNETKQNKTNVDSIFVFRIESTPSRMNVNPESRIEKTKQSRFLYCLDWREKLIAFKRKKKQKILVL